MLSSSRWSMLVIASHGKSRSVNPSLNCYGCCWFGFSCFAWPRLAFFSVSTMFALFLHPKPSSQIMLKANGAAWPAALLLLHPFAKILPRDRKTHSTTVGTQYSAEHGQSTNWPEIRSANLRIRIAYWCCCCCMHAEILICTFKRLLNYIIYWKLCRSPSSLQ